jgi:hypothetical protein
MSSFKSNISEILADEAILAISVNNHSKPDGTLELIENGKDATLKHPKLIHIKDSDTCFTFDVTGEQKFKTFSPYLKSLKKHDFNKRCDFIIVRKQNDVWHVYFGDLKSTRVEKRNVLKQLAASQLFFDYILAILQAEFGNEELLNYEPNFVCIHDNAKASSPAIQRSTTIPGNAAPYRENIDGKKLIIMPVGVSSNGRARVSFNKICQ